MPRIGEVLESALYVDDVERSVRFYEEALGLSRALVTDRIAAMRVNRTQVLLLFKKGASTEPITTPGGVIPPNDGDGEMHVALSIPESEIEAWEGALSEAGVSVESRVRWEEGGQSLYFRDPDRNLIELKTTAWDGKQLDW